jgi:hypothetical protein
MSDFRGKVNFIWSVADENLRGDFKRSKYPDVMDHFFEEAAEGQMPLQAEPTDPVVLEKLKAFTKKYGYEFAEFPSGP